MRYPLLMSIGVLALMLAGCADQSASPAGSASSPAASTTAADWSNIVTLVSDGHSAAAMVVQIHGPLANVTFSWGRDAVLLGPENPAGIVSASTRPYTDCGRAGIRIFGPEGEIRYGDLKDVIWAEVNGESPMLSTGDTTITPPVPVGPPMAPEVTLHRAAVFTGDIPPWETFVLHVAQSTSSPTALAPFVTITADKAVLEVVEKRELFHECAVGSAAFQGTQASLGSSLGAWKEVLDGAAVVTLPVPVDVSAYFLPYDWPPESKTLASCKLDITAGGHSANSSHWSGVESPDRFGCVGRATVKAGDVEIRISDSRGHAPKMGYDLVEVCYRIAC